MAYLVRRGLDRIEIRESLATPRGPRARVLASFTGALTPDVLARAAAQASRPFDPRALVRRARVRGIEVAERSREAEARALLARLRRDDPLDRVMAGLLRRALEGVPAEEPPEALAEAAAWVGAGPAERGAALRELLDTYGTIAASRPTRRARPRERFPRFASVGETG